MRLAREQLFAEGAIEVKGKRILASAVALALATAPVLAEAPSTSPDTSAEIRDLKARLEQLEAQQRDSERRQADAARQQQEQAATQAVTKDAASHDNLLDLSGVTAGYNTDTHRFFLGTDDGNFMLRPWLHMQFRDVTMWRQNYKAASKDDQVDNGFEMRRMRFGVDGNVISPDLTYFFNWATSRTSGNATVKNGSTTVGTVSNSLGGVPLLEEAWVKYRFHETPFYVWGGQIKDPVYHDQIVSSRYQHGTERSLTGDVFTNGDAFTEGVAVIYDPATFLRATAGVNHGMRSANTNFLDYPNNGSYNAFNYGAVGRVEYKVMGRWQDYGQIGAVENKEPLLVLGAGGDYSERGHAGQTVGAADAMFANPEGLSLFGAFLDRYTNHNFGIYTQSPTGASIIGNPDSTVLNRATNEYSLVGEIGYIFNKTIEPYGRFEYMHLQGTPAGSHNWVQEITGGVNWYFSGYRSKLTFEGKYLPHGIPIDDGPSDVLASPNGRGEFVFTAQYQLLL